MGGNEEGRSALRVHPVESLDRELTTRGDLQPNGGTGYAQYIAARASSRYYFAIVAMPSRMCLSTSCVGRQMWGGVSYFQNVSRSSVAAFMAHLPLCDHQQICGLRVGEIQVFDRDGERETG